MTDLSDRQYDAFDNPAKCAGTGISVSCVKRPTARADG
jgi:hypothetical protein